jgi:hypothetical protein
VWSTLRSGAHDFSFINPLRGADRPLPSAGAPTRNGSSALPAPKVVAVDGIDQGIDTVLIRKALGVPKLMRVAPHIFHERGPVERGSKVVGGGRPVSIDVLTASRASGVHTTIVTLIGSSRCTAPNGSSAPQPDRLKARWVRWATARSS